jgi:hypothetical protein
LYIAKYAPKRSTPAMMTRVTLSIFLFLSIV